MKKDSKEAAEEETKKIKKMRLSEPHFLWKVRWQLAVKFCLPTVIPIKKIRVNKKSGEPDFYFFSFIVVNSEPLNTSKARTNR